MIENIISFILNKLLLLVMGVGDGHKIGEAILKG
jgi:hypothetical protein